MLAQPADGHTLVLGSYSTHVIAPLASKQNAEMTKAALDGFTALGVFGHAPLLLAVNAASPHRTFAQFIESAKTRRTTYGTFGTGSSAHLLGEIVAANTQAQLQHVPYKGSAPATTDLLGQHVDSVILTVAALQPLVTKGELRALAVSSKARMPSLPQVPTFDESDQQGLAETGWFAVFVPAKAPADAMQRLATTLVKVLAEAEVKAKLVELGLEPVSAKEAIDAQAMWRRSVDSAKALLSRTKVELD